MTSSGDPCQNCAHYRSAHVGACAAGGHVLARCTCTRFVERPGTPGTPWVKQPGGPWGLHTTFEDDLEVVASGCLPGRCELGHELDSDECWEAGQAHWKEVIRQLPVYTGNPGDPDGPPIGSCYAQEDVGGRVCGMPRGHAGTHSWWEPGQSRAWGTGPAQP